MRPCTTSLRSLLHLPSRTASSTFLASTFTRSPPFSLSSAHHPSSVLPPRLLIQSRRLSTTKTSFLNLPKVSNSLRAKATKVLGAKGRKVLQQQRPSIPFFDSSFPPFPFFFSHRFASTLAVPSSTQSPPPPHVDPTLTSATSAEPILTSPQVATYLFVIAGMVFTIVVVGGMTRLTESGLSITEWNVVSGVLPPMGEADWASEFEKYKLTPEWRIQNQHITLSEFKRIYFWEWSHRILGRVIGLSFLLPLPYFYLRRRLSPRTTLSLLSIGTLIGGQGALGWYMVKSGLDEKSVQDLGGVPRVSQYRLAAHLGMAFLVYVGCLRLGLGVGRDWKVFEGKKGLGGVEGIKESLRLLDGKVAGRMRMIVTALTGLVFLTAISGAFVAGLDAGLVYNEFPLMGGRVVPPKEELISTFYSRKKDGTGLWRNFFENPTTVQFDHRVLATTTFASIVSLFLFARRPSIRPHLPPTTFRLLKGTMHMATLQVALGISTLIYLVPIHLAATHQAGSLVLLSLVVAMGASLRRPGKVARELMRLRKV